LLRTADRAYLAGLGDPFGSPCYCELLATTQPEDAPTLKWYILTNGHGFTPERYAAIPTHAQIDRVQFSIDAATEETYALNRQSDWSTLCDNLAFVGGLRRNGILDQLDISMVVQRNNYKEAVEFVEFGKANNVDSVLFSCLLPMRDLLIDVADRSVLMRRHPENEQATKMLDLAKTRGKDLGVNVMVEMPR
jgi:MoaA/NifB/PqqE/SkfB family radical SAM enzyme